VLERLRDDNLAFPDGLENSLSSTMRQSLAKALAVLPENRLQSIRELQSYLLNETIRLAKTEIAATQVLPADMALPAPPEISAAPIGSRKAATEAQAKSFYQSTAAILLIVVIAVAALAGGGYWYYRQTQTPVNQLEKKGISFTEDAFYNAVRTDDQDTVKLFLAAGMNVNQSKSVNAETPVMVAIEAGQMPMVKFLIAAGADLTYKDEQGRTPVSVAIKQGNTQILKLLMDQLHLTPDTKDDKGKTILENAIASGNIATVKFLIEQGANINLQDGSGNTLLDRAIANGNQQLAAVLKSAGAKRNINKSFKPGQLNEIKLPYSRTNGFEVDLLGDGMGQTITIQNQDFAKSSVTVTQEGRQHATFNIYGSSHYWYVAYLRDDKVPDLVYFYIAGSGGFVNDFKIIGKTGKDTVGLLFSPDLSMLGYLGIGSGASLSMDGNRLIVSSGANRVAVVWNAEQQVYHFKLVP